MDKPAPITFEAHVRNRLGFHSRVAARLFRVASGFRADVLFENLTTGAGPIDAKSFSAITASGTAFGHSVRFTIAGDDQSEAAAELRTLADAGFPGTDEGTATEDGPTEAAERLAAEAAERLAAEPADQPAADPAATERPVPAAAALPGARTGHPGAPGIALGPIWSYRDADVVPEASPVRADTTVDQRIRAAAVEAAAQLRSLGKVVRAARSAQEAAIFDAQALLAADERLLSAAILRAGDARGPEHVDAASATEAAFADAAARQAALPDERLAARGSDLLDVGARIARILRGQSMAVPPQPSVVVADDLPPSAFAEIPPELLLGVAMARGSATSHVVILARARRVPAVVGVTGLLDAAAGARDIGIDGATGEAVLDPSGIARAELRRRRQARYEHRAPASPAARGLTKDGKHVPLFANISSPQDAERALDAGAEGIGLFRTEFLFMGRASAPGEDEQTAAYRQVFESFGPDRRVVIRLADLGGDKSVPYLESGLRETSLIARDADLIRTQLRAIWRAAAAAGPGIVPHVMAPMVATLADVEQLRLLRDETRRTAAATVAALPARMVIGAMIERPEAVEIARQLAHRLDFFSIGTNDLTRLALGADREDPELGGPESALHPAVLRLIARTVHGADAEGIPVAACGELAGSPIGALALVALGVDELSADASALDEVRSALARLTRAELDVLGRTVLAAPDAVAVRARVAELLGR